MGFNLYIPDESLLNQKIAQIRSGWVDKMSVISDFDRTLTRMTFGDRKITGWLAMIREWGHLPDEYVLRARKLFEDYHPIEIDSIIPLEEKIPKMIEWATAHMWLFVEYKLQKQQIIDTASQNLSVLRSWFSQMLDTLDSNWIPLVVSSAGSWDLIRAFLMLTNASVDRVFVHSNHLTFDENGFAIWHGNIVNILDKDLSKVDFWEHQKEINGRTSRIILGDGLQDAVMADGLESTTTLKVWFLNMSVERDLAAFCEAFDMVITWDSSLWPVEELLYEILN